LKKSTATFEKINSHGQATFEKINSHLKKSTATFEKNQQPLLKKPTAI
jgi:hypothetical protein